MTASSRPGCTSLQEFVRAARALAPGETIHYSQPLTVEEYCRIFTPEDRWLELVDGAVYMRPRLTDRWQALHVWLFVVISTYVEELDLGRALGPRSGVRLSATSLPEPDLLFYSREHCTRLNPSGVHGIPDLIIEIVDSDLTRRDIARRQVQYQDVGVTELWVIDLPRNELRQFTLVNGLYQRQMLDLTGEVIAHTVPGLYLRVEWLFQASRFPSSRTVVNNLLAAHSQPE